MICYLFVWVALKLRLFTRTVEAFELVSPMTTVVDIELKKEERP